MYVAPVGLVDDRAIQVGRQFLHASAAVVHPGLDDFDLLRGQLSRPMDATRGGRFRDVRQRLDRLD